MKKNKKKFLSILLALSILLSLKFGMKKHGLFSTNLYYGMDGLDKSIAKVLDYDEADLIKYVGRFVPQGVCVVDNKIIISLYDSLCFSNSILCVYDTLDKTYSKVTLDMIAHTGGMAYDEINNLLWITAKDGNVRCYNLDEIDNKSMKSLSKDIFVGNDLINHKGNCSAAYMCINDNKLYVGNYVLSGNAILKEYKIINDNGFINLEYVRQFNIPNKTQGVCFYDKGDKEYIMFSRSYGTTFDSLLQIYEFDDEFDANISNSVNYYFEPMMEQIYIESDTLYGIFEYNANIYRDGAKKDDLFCLDVNKLIKKNEN